MDVIAFYLPQFYPTPENDKWWGKGYTEWTNVGKAKPLFRNHDQPKVPADLGYYDLRLPEVRAYQAELAKEAGIKAFCYWHYWLGGGKRVLEMPINEVLRTKKPDFPFCLGWANHNWYKKSWNSNSSWISKEKLLEQTYPGKDDVDNHFYHNLKAFQDDRYYKVNNKPLFLIYEPNSLPDTKYFINRWNNLAVKNGLIGIYFIAHINHFNPRANLHKYIEDGFDSVNLSLHWLPFGNFSSFQGKVKRFIKNVLFRTPNVVEYKFAIKMMDHQLFEEDWILPTIIPNWDHTPRSGKMGRVFHNSNPELFGRHIEAIFKRCINKTNKIVLLKSWNEWGEGNYLEPDIKYGKANILKLKSMIEKYSSNDTL